MEIKQVTIRNLEQCSAQEVFQFVVTHLLTQRIPAFDDDGHPKYFMPDGRKCAIGCLIPPDMYNPNIEDEAWSGEVSFRYGVASERCHESLLGSLQVAHDTSSPDDWKFTFRGIGEKLGLDISFIN